MRQFLNICFFTVLVVCARESFAQVQAHELQIVSHAFIAEYQDELAKNNSKLLINRPPTAGATDFWWNLDAVRASYSTSYESGARTHYIFVMGGYARQPGMTVDGLIATICHELGHGLAGAPYKDGQDSGAKISVEGQADYFAYRSCVPRMFKRLGTTKMNRPVSAQMAKLCSVVTNSVCMRALQTLETEKAYFWNSTQTHVDIFSYDPSVAIKTDLRPDYYPSPQCRLDTMLAGIIGSKRPACWFKEEF